MSSVLVHVGHRRAEQVQRHGLLVRVLHRVDHVPVDLAALRRARFHAPGRVALREIEVDRELPAQRALRAREIAQVEAYAPIHVRAVDPSRSRVIEGSATEVEDTDARLLEQPALEEQDDEEPLE